MKSERKIRKRPGKKTIKMRHHRQPALVADGRLAMMAQMLKGLGAPAVLLQLVVLYFTNTCWPRTFDIDQVEFFAGKSEVTQASVRRGYTAIAYDNNRDEVYMDFCGIGGFICALSYALNLRESGHAWFAPVRIINSLGNLGPLRFHLSVSMRLSLYVTKSLRKWLGSFPFGASTPYADLDLDAN